MAGPYHTYSIAHGPRTQLRVLLNDIPFYRVMPDRTGVTEASVADHLLVPGANTATLELIQAEEHYHVYFAVLLDRDRDHPLFELVWPVVYERLPVVFDMPISVTLPLLMPGVTFRSAYLDAPPAHFGPDGTPELREAVRRFHDTLVRADAESYLAETALKREELQRAYPGSPFLGDQYLRERFADRFSQGLRVDPLEKLVFEPCADGRVAFVTRSDGGKPIVALSPDGGGMDHDLWFTWHRGAWRLFR